MDNTFENTKKNTKSNSKNKIKYNDKNLENIEIEIYTFKNEDFSSLDLPKNKDLIPGKYEGGIKIWECSLDLCNFLPEYVGWYNLDGLKILELGSGHGLPGLYFLLRNCNVMFQDYNQEILDNITLSYINQIKTNYNVDLSGNVALMNGDWKDFTQRINELDFKCDNKDNFSQGEFDMIVSADTIYNIENYESFYSVIKNHLKNPGICFVCSKKYYFGVGGGTSQFIDFVNKKGEFDISVAKEINDKVSNIRQILEIRHKN
jgi:hypothetical protein